MPSASAATAGTAVITHRDGVTAVKSGGPTDLWTLKLPQGASCSGDTATRNFHTYSYVVPSSLDPNTLVFSSNGPDHGYPLVDQFGTPMIAVNTAPQTGQVIMVPNDFNWSAFSIDGRNSTPALPAGTYNLGVACQNDNAGRHLLDKIWNAEVTFTASSASPTGFTWTVPGQSAAATVPSAASNASGQAGTASGAASAASTGSLPSTGTSILRFGGGAAVLLGVGLAVVVIVRRRRAVRS